MSAAATPASAPPRLSAAESGRLTALATTVSVLTALALTAVKAAAWRLGGSTSLLASTADSALDLVAALGAFWAVRYAVAPPDAEHRFGHGKAEAFASLLQAGLVIASAALIGREAVERVLHPAAVRAEAAGLAVMAVSIAATVGLVTLQGWVVARTRSVAVAGDRAHYAADLLSNVAALLGLGLARLTGDTRWDALAGLVVAAWLVWGAVGVFRTASREIMDRELDEAERERILDLACADERIVGVHQVRTRASGPFLHVQMHMDLHPDQSLVEAHAVIAAAERRILSAFPSADVLIHPDPYGHAEVHEREFDGAS